MSMSCNGRRVIVRRDKGAKGRLIDAQLLWAGSDKDATLDELNERAADIEAEATPVDGATYVEIEVVEL